MILDIGSFKAIILKNVERNQLNLSTDLPYLILPDFKVKNSYLLSFYCNDDFLHCVDIYVDELHVCMVYISKEESKPTVGKRLVTSVKNYGQVDTILQTNCTMEFYTTKNFRGMITKYAEKDFNINFIQGDKIVKKILRKSDETDSIVHLMTKEKFAQANSSLNLTNTVLKTSFGNYCLYEAVFGRDKIRLKEQVLELMASIYRSYKFEVLEIKYLNKLMEYEQEAIEELEIIQKKIIKEKKDYNKKEFDTKLMMHKEKFEKETKMIREDIKKEINMNNETIKNELEVYENEYDRLLDESRKIEDFYDSIFGKIT